MYKKIKKKEEKDKQLARTVKIIILFIQSNNK